MKTRIISGVVMALILAAVLLAGFLWNGIVITATIALLALGAVYELLHNAVGIKDKLSFLGAGAFAFIFIFVMAYKSEYVLVLSVVYFIFAVFMVLKNHEEFSLSHIAALCGLPIPYAYAFSCLGGVINHKDGIYYLLLLLNFSSVCDMGAYFAGSFLGKHKLCPKISPKKTVEGAVGGVISSLIVTAVLTLCFGKSILFPLLFTVPFCILGMIGDLFASAIKRSVGLKDYSNLIPGHGGILDRVDSIIMIVPLMYILIGFAVL